MICAKCNYETTENYNYNRHLESKLHKKNMGEISQKTYKCDETDCSYTTINSSNLNRHKKTHKESQDRIHTYAELMHLQLKHRWRKDWIKKHDLPYIKDKIKRKEKINEFRENEQKMNSYCRQLNKKKENSKHCPKNTTNGKSISKNQKTSVLRKQEDKIIIDK